MSSFKDKIKSKIKSKHQQQQTMEAFDQNSLKVSLLPVKNQLAEIKIQCSWNNIKNTMKIPKLNCKWYNRTQNNMQQIVGIQDQSYQPSIVDIGSIIQITCVPQVPGIAYEGMPILLKTNIINLACETETTATQLFSYGKANFFIDIKQSKIINKPINQNSQGFIKVQNNALYVCHVKFGQLYDQILKQLNIDQNFPQFLVHRRLSRQLTIKFNQDQHIVAYFKNHETRDVFCLLNKLIVSKVIQQKQQTNKQKKLQQGLSTQSHQIQNNFQKQIQKFNQLHNKVEKDQKKKQEYQTIQKYETKQHSKQNIKYQTQNYKQSTSELLETTNLKLQIKRLGAQNGKLLKEVQNQKDKNYTLGLRISQMKERLQNASINYFSLQKQLIAAKQINQARQKSIQILKAQQTGRQQTILYYTTQIKLLSQQKIRLQQTIRDIRSNYIQVSKTLEKYQLLYGSQNSKSYIQLQNQLNSLKLANKQLKLKYEYTQEEKQKIQQSLKNSRNIIQNIQSQKKYIQKKYQSLSNQIASPIMKSKRSERSIESSLSNISVVLEDIPQSNQKSESVGIAIYQQNKYRENQIQPLRRQNKQLKEQNNYVRNLLVKQKKSTSKAHIKLQLFQIKKIVGNLSEAIVQKDLLINNLKQINKQLNKKNNSLELQLRALKQKLY